MHIIKVTRLYSSPQSHEFQNTSQIAMWVWMYIIQIFLTLSSSSGSDLPIAEPGPMHRASFVINLLVWKMVSDLSCQHTGWLVSSSRKIRNLYTLHRESDISYPSYYPSRAEKEEDVSCLGNMNFFSCPNASLISGLKEIHRA